MHKIHIDENATILSRYTVHKHILASRYDDLFVSLVDALHAYFGICGMSLLGEPGLHKMYAALNISQRATDHLHAIHKEWQGAN